MVDFEEADVVNGWDFDREAWQVVNEGGQNLLIGHARLNQPIVVLGRENPEWLDPIAADLIIRFNFQLDPGSGGLRVVFHYDQSVGYNVLELFPGIALLRRSGSTPNVLDRGTESVIRQASVPIAEGNWHSATIWAEGSRYYVYLDHSLVMTAEDLTLPQLGAGQIMLQGNSVFSAVRVDDLIIQRAEAISDHFEGASLPPSTWQTTSTTNSEIREESGNQYVFMQNEVEVEPIMAPVQDFNLRCRIWSEQGGYTLYLRESAGGSMQFALSGGNLVITELDSAGEAVTSYQTDNFYTRNRWQDLDISFIGNRLEIYLDGRSRFEDTLDTAPPSGTMRFITRRGDVLRFDDCLLTQTSTTTTAGAAFAFEIQDEVLARDFRWLRSDLDENFNDIAGTDDWWEGGMRAAGEFLSDTSSTDHQYFLRMTHAGAPTFRLFRDIIGVEIFGAGQDRNNYRDSTDLYVTVDVRIVGEEGSGWLGIRNTRSITGVDIQGYLFEVRRTAQGTAEYVVRYQSATEQISYFDGPLPGSEEEPIAEWTQLLAISYNDQIAFFANGRFVAAVDNAIDLGGSVALGVEDGSTADFDTLIIRDASPHGGQ